MIKGIEAVIETLELERCPYWNIKKGMKEPIMFQDNAKEFENLQLNSSMDRLRQVLGMLQNGKYLIEYYDTPDAKNTRKKIDFVIEGSTAPVQGFNNPQPAIDIEDKIAKAVANERQKWETTEKINQLEKEINEHKAAKVVLEKELKQAVADKDDVWTRVANKVEPYLGAIIPAFLPKLGLTPAVAGGTDIHLDDTTDNEENNPLTIRLTNALNIWEKTEKMEEIVSLIEIIATLTQNNPTMYNTAKGILKV